MGTSDGPRCCGAGWGQTCRPVSWDSSAGASRTVYGCQEGSHPGTPPPPGATLARGGPGSKVPTDPARPRTLGPVSDGWPAVWPARGLVDRSLVP